MTETIVVNRSLTKNSAIFSAVLLLDLVGGFAAGLLFIPTYSFDLLLIFIWFLGFPVFAAALGTYIGWRRKKIAVDYTSPEWKFTPTQYDIAEIRSFLKEYHRKYSRLEARSHYWFFQVPILLLVFLPTFPFYVFYVDASFAYLLPVVLAAGVAIIHITSWIGTYRATTNDASPDFTLPLIREAIWLAKQQAKVKGVSEVRVVLDRAEHEGYEIVKNPRVIIRMDGVEDEGYIESWSEDLRAVTRIFSRLLQTNDHEQIIWWWLSRDRLFRKYSDSNKDGYYVKFPVAFLGRELGVRDVKLVTANAVAIFLLEILTRRDDEHIKELLHNLGVEP
jgi:hypothetical protein